MLGCSHKKEQAMARCWVVATSLGVTPAATLQAQLVMIESRWETSQQDVACLQLKALDLGLGLGIGLGIATGLGLERKVLGKSWGCTLIHSWGCTIMHS